MKNLKFIIFIFSIFPTFLFAQLKLKGKVVFNDGTPIKLATVTIKKDTLLIQDLSTENDGSFLADLKKGIYTYDVSYKGELLFSKIIDLAQDEDLGTIPIVAEKKIEEVIIRKSKKSIDRKSDRYIINVEKSVMAVGSDVLTMLGKTPGIKVVKDEIKLVGKEGMQVAINGKVLQLNKDGIAELLKAIPSSDVSRIEVLTNPSSAYDAQGSSGIVNIILKKGVRKGYSLTYNSNYTQHKYATFGNNLSLTYDKEKWSINSNLNFERGKDFVEQDVSTYYPDQYFLGTSSYAKDNKKFNLFSDIQYKISEKSKLNFSFLVSNTKSEYNTGSKISILRSDNEIDRYYLGDDYLNSKLNKASANLQYRKEFDSLGQSLVIEADWFMNKGKFHQYLSGQDYTITGVPIPDKDFVNSSYTNIKTNIYSLNNTYVYPKLKLFNLTVGAKLLFIDLNTDSQLYQNIEGQFTYNREQSPVSNYKENRQAVFFDLNKKLEDWDLQAGLRLENTLIKGNTLAVENQYFENKSLNLFPSLNVVYNINEKDNLSFNYGKRINRPEFRLLNPFRSYYNAYDYWEGNPQTIPSISQNFNLAYNFRSKHNLSLSYSHTKNAYEQIAYFYPNSVVGHTTTNYMNLNAFQLMAATSFKPLKMLETNLQLQGYYKINNSLIDVIQNTNFWGWYGSINNQISFNTSKTITGEANFWYTLGDLQLEAYVKKQYSLDLGLKFSFLKEDLNIVLNATDVLKSMREISSITTNNINQTLKNYWTPPSFRLSVQYKFGNRKKEFKKRESENAEEQNR